MAGALLIREAVRDDLPAIVALLADDRNGALREDARLPLDPGYLAAFDAIASLPNQELIAAERDDQVIGTIQLSYLPGLSYRGRWRGQIEAVRIATALRGQGLGSVMIAWAVERCRAHGCGMVQLTSMRNRPDAHRFYERLGWERSHYGFKLTLD